MRTDDCHRLRLRQLGIDTLQERVVYMRRDCHVCRSEGFSAQSRVRVLLGARSLIATIHVVDDHLLGPGEAGLSAAAWRALSAEPGGEIVVAHAPPLESLAHVRAKIYGHRLGADALRTIVRDIASGLYSDVHISSFVTSCAGDRLDLPEVVALTRAMIDAGERLRWERRIVADKHCVGGLPGNRTTLILVPIVAACGVTIPKTSSRAITSPSGTADAMETLAPVDIDLARMRRVVDRTGGCIAWGGALALSPADDVLIGVERALDLDSEGQLVASVLSKKAAAGATHVVIDMPVGPTAKVRDGRQATRLEELLTAVGVAVGLVVKIVRSDGRQPVGRGIGPALEARAACSVLQRAPDRPLDLERRAVELAAEALAMAGAASGDLALAMAWAALEDGRAWRKFQAICEEQGGMREPPVAPFRRTVVAVAEGVVAEIDNRRLARVAKLAGAPHDRAAGVEIEAPLGSRVAAGGPLFTVHAESRGELEYALDYARAQPSILRVEEPA